MLAMIVLGTTAFANVKPVPAKATTSKEVKATNPKKNKKVGRVKKTTTVQKGVSKTK